MKVGDRVQYVGPVVNVAWNPERVGTVERVSRSGRIDIRWDGGGLNMGHDPAHFAPVSALGHHDQKGQNDE